MKHNPQRRCLTLCSQISSFLPPTPNFNEYREAKNNYLTSQKSLLGKSILRLDCMKPQSALSHLILPLPIVGKPFSQPYGEDCKQLIRLWCSISGVDARDVVLTKGVRDGLYLLLSSVESTADEVIWPSDVYPVYEKLIHKTTLASKKLTRFSTLNILDMTILNNASNRAVLILTVPLTPSGQDLGLEYVQQLLSWVNDSPFRKIFLDCVYSYDIKSGLVSLGELSHHPQVALCFSLAKSWASPFLEPHVLDNVLDNACTVSLERRPSRPVPRESFSRGVGFTRITDKDWFSNYQSLCEMYQMSPTQDAVNKAQLIISRQPKLPLVFNKRFQQQWSKLLPSIRSVIPSFSFPLSGYFKAIPMSYVELAEKKHICAVPASVFGSSDASTAVISCLYDIKDDDLSLGIRNSILAESLAETATVPDTKDTDLYHVTTLSNFIRGYDKYRRVYSKRNITESRFPDKFFLLREDQLQIGIDKAFTLMQKLALTDDALLILHTKIDMRLCTLHPKGQYIRQDWIDVKSLSLLRPNSTGIEKLTVEEASSLSLRLNHHKLLPYSQLKPRSVSILPIAKGCQARCPFCFSKGSVSNDLLQKLIPRQIIDVVLNKARESGAERAVITGGGEPMMMPFERLLDLVSQCSIFNTVCMITNGYFLSQLDELERESALSKLDDSGLTVLSVSRHAVTEEHNEQIMYLKTQSGRVAETWSKMNAAGRFKRLKKYRWVCVLQEGGVDSDLRLSEYLQFAVESGVPEICFKELYVSTSVESLYHDAASNAWSEKHQVPLSLVIRFCEQNGFKKHSELPWGAPVYEGFWSGRPLRIAAYTEPSVFWERVNGLCRSWNLMADKSVLASLEDRESRIDYEVNDA